MWPLVVLNPAISSVIETMHAGRHRVLPWAGTRLRFKGAVRMMPTDTTLQDMNENLGEDGEGV